MLAYLGRQTLKLQKNRYVRPKQDSCTDLTLMQFFFARCTSNLNAWMQCIHILIQYLERRVTNSDDKPILVD